MGCGGGLVRATEASQKSGDSKDSRDDSRDDSSEDGEDGGDGDEDSKDDDSETGEPSGQSANGDVSSPGQDPTGIDLKTNDLVPMPRFAPSTGHLHYPPGHSDDDS